MKLTTEASDPLLAAGMLGHGALARIPGFPPHFQTVSRFKAHPPPSARRAFDLRSQVIL